jgi:hypothetical protein
MRNSERTEDLLVQAFAKVDAVALGIACGIVSALGLFLATISLVIKGGRVIGPNLGLVSHYFSGYSVTWTGSVIGAVYGLVAGFFIGWMLASIRNFSIAVYAHGMKLWANLSQQHFLDRFDS